MEITGVKIFKTKKRGAILAYANIILDNSFIIRGITLLETEEKGRFIAMPSRMLRNNERRTHRDICHPLNNDVRDELVETIFEAYDEYIETEEN